MLDIRWRILLVALGGWANRRQLEVIAYLREENRILKDVDSRLIPVLGIDTCQHVAGDAVFYRGSATLERQPDQASRYGDGGKNASEHRVLHGELLERVALPHQSPRRPSRMRLVTAVSTRSRPDPLGPAREAAL